MKQTAVILFFAGLVLFTAVVGYYGITEILTSLAAVGAGLLVVSATHLIPLLLDSLAWRPLLFHSGEDVRLVRLLKARWIGESINSLLPAAQVGGDFIRARMLAAQGVSAHVAGASVVCELTISVVTQVLFTIMGIGCLIFMGENSMAVMAAAGAAILLLLSGCFVLAQRMGMWQKFVNVLAMLGGEARFSQLSVKAEALDRAVMEIYRQPRALLLSAAWRLAGWIGGVVEVWVALELLNAPVSFVEAFMLESLGQAVRAAAFLVPGALGVQESGFVLLGRLVGLTPEIALSLSLAKRFRELSLGLPGLALWQAEEGAALFQRIKNIVRSL